MDYSKLQNHNMVLGNTLPAHQGAKPEIDEQTVYTIARAFSAWLRDTLHKSDVSIAVGCDARLTSPSLMQAVSDGLVFDGVDVFEAGQAPEPALFMSTVFPETSMDGAIMVSGADHPATDNGLRFYISGSQLDEEELKEVLDRAAHSRFRHLSNGSVSGIDLGRIYADYLKDTILARMDMDVEKPLSGLKVVVDASNGTGGFFATQILSDLGADITGSVCLEPDGTFPAHEPSIDDEGAINILKEAISDNHAHLGLLIDGDASNVLILDENGDKVSRNDLTRLRTYAEQTYDQSASADSGDLYNVTQMVLEALHKSVSDLLRDLDKVKQEDIASRQSRDAFGPYKEQVLEDLSNYVKESDTLTSVDVKRSSAIITYEEDGKSGRAEVSLCNLPHNIEVRFNKKSGADPVRVKKELYDFLEQYPSLILDQLADNR